MASRIGYAVPSRGSVEIPSRYVKRAASFGLAIWALAAASIPVVLLALAVLSQTDDYEELRLRSREALQHEERVTVSALSLLYQMSETEARQRLYLLT